MSEDRYALAAEARRMAARGWWVFPIANKRPLTPHGLHDAVDRPDEAYDLFMSCRHATHIGVPTGIKTMLVCIDVDPAGHHWLAYAWHKLGLTLVHRSPRGGLHIFYNMPKPPAPVIGSRQICDGRPLLAHGVDIQGEGRSITFYGPSYTVSHDHPIADMPKWLIGRLTRQPKKPKPFEPLVSPNMAAFERVLAKVQHSKEGERNALVYWGACRAGEAVAAGLLSEPEAISLVAARGVAAGLNELEARRTAQSGVRTTGRK